MGKVLFAVCAFLGLCIIGLGVLSYVARDEETLAVDNLLAEDIARAIGTAESERDGTVELAQVARFAWDEVLLVAPGTQREAISVELGYEWKGDVNFGVTDTLIFLDDRQVVRFADYRGEGVFDGFERPFDRIARGDSTLRVRNLAIMPS